MKMAGPTVSLADAWERLGKKIKLEVPKGSGTEDSHTFLGCVHNRVDRIVSVGGTQRTIRCMEYDMSASMSRTVVKYEEAVERVTGFRPRITGKGTPFLPEDTTKAPQRAPCAGGGPVCRVSRMYAYFL